MNHKRTIFQKETCQRFELQSVGCGNSPGSFYAKLQVWAVAALLKWQERHAGVCRGVRVFRNSCQVFVVWCPPAGISVNSRGASHQGKRSDSGEVVFRCYHQKDLVRKSNFHPLYESATSAIHLSPISKTLDSRESARSIVSRKKREGPSPSRRPWSARWKRFRAVSRAPFS